MNTILILTLILGLLIIVALACYAYSLHLKLRKQSREQQQRELVLAEELGVRRQHYRKSIRVICSALLAGQVNITEAAIRISMLIRQLQLTEDEEENCRVFFQLTEATAHIPILDEWKKLSKSEKQNFDQEREGLEHSFHDFIMSAAQQLLDSLVAEESTVYSDGAKNRQAEPLFYAVGNTGTKNNLEKTDTIK